MRGPPDEGVWNQLSEGQSGFDDDAAFEPAGEAITSRPPKSAVDTPRPIEEAVVHAPHSRRRVRALPCRPNC